MIIYTKEFEKTYPPTEITCIQMMITWLHEISSNLSIAMHMHEHKDNRNNNHLQIYYKLQEAVHVNSFTAPFQMNKKDLNIKESKLISS
jgi:hypothetical protein